MALAQTQKPANERTSSASSATAVGTSEEPSDKNIISPPPRWRRYLTTLNWKPPNTRWNPEKPPVFSMGTNILFAFAGAFTVANLYYSHPILNILATDFGVPYEKVSQIPTLAQAGYAVGLFFLCPLGDIFHRRPFVLLLVFFTSTLWIGLCLTKSFAVFSAISFLTAVTTVTPQLMLPLVGDLAPPHRRAASLSIVTAGNLLGILIARLLSGIVTNYIWWRYVYIISLALQYIIFILLWLFMPDYPSTNPAGINYFRILFSMVLMLPKHPVLVQACLISLANSAPFTCFWTTLTFLLAGPPYFYSPLIIGLFALIGIAGMCCTPLYARLVMDRFVPLFSVITGATVNLIGICIGTYAGTHTIAGPIIQAFFLDLGLQVTQIANRSSIYAVEPKGRNRINTIFMVATFLGQIMGTSAGNRIYAKEGGWIASGSWSVGMIGFALLVTFARGPWEEGWVGWTGGWSIHKKDRMSADGKVAEKGAMYTRKIVGSGCGGGEGTTEDHNEVKKVKDVEAGTGTGATELSTSEKALEEAAGEDGELHGRDVVEVEKSGQ